jgi:outer membrane immunogenic protein
VTGVAIGGTAGCDRQFGVLVIGGEGDFSWTRVKGTGQLAPPFTGSESFETNETWLNTERLRVGAAVGHWLAYGTGGLAFASEGETLCVPNAPACAISSHIVMGWTAGAGVEYALSNNWAVRLEYLFVDLGTTYFPEVPVGASFYRAEDSKLTNSLFRLGLDVKF